jgi:hypothetical protein
MTIGQFKGGIGERPGPLGDPLAEWPTMFPCGIAPTNLLGRCSWIWARDCHDRRRSREWVAV